MTLTQSRTVSMISQGARGLEGEVGNTPLVELRRITAGLAPGVRIFGKAEWFNPSGSVKDRPAVRIMRSAIAAGHLGHGKRLLDSTSGNMGIAYATFGTALGVGVTLCVPASASPERITVLNALHAEVILTDPAEGSDGAVLAARQLAESQPDKYWYANQYDNPENYRAHFATTGPEVLRQTDGSITHFVAGIGTSGTLLGTGTYLRENIGRIQIIAVQPDAAFHGLEGLKHMPSAIKPGIFDASFADETMAVRTEAAHEMVRALARQEGLFVGVSSGAALVATLDVAGKLRSGCIVAVFPDGGYRYLSDRVLWEGA